MSDQSGEQPGYWQHDNPAAGAPGEPPTTPYAAPPAAPGYGYPPPPPAGYPAQGYAYPPAYGYYVPPPKHPQATTAMVLGLVSIVGGLMFCLPLLCSPFAWFYGQRALREIRESKGQLSGDGEARVGQVLGIIGTVLIVLGLVCVIGLVVLALTTSSSVGGSGTST